MNAANLHLNRSKGPWKVPPKTASSSYFRIFSTDVMREKRRITIASIVTQLAIGRAMTRPKNLHREKKLAHSFLHRRSQTKFEQMFETEAQSGKFRNGISLLGGRQLPFRNCPFWFSFRFVRRLSSFLFSHLTSFCVHHLIRVPFFARSIGTAWFCFFFQRTLFK